MYRVLVAGVPDGERDIQHWAKVVDLGPHVVSVQGLVGCLDIEGEDYPISPEPREDAEGVGTRRVCRCPADGPRLRP